MRRSRYLHALSAIASLLAFPSAGFSQHALNTGTSPQDKLNTTKELGFRHGSVIVAPVPFENPAIGTGLALGGGYLFQTDVDSSTSAIGGGAFRTKSGSEGYALGVNLNFDSDQWKTTFLIGDVDLNYDLYILKNPVPLKQSAKGMLAKVLYGITPDLYLGVAASYAESTVGPDIGVVLPPSLAPDLDLEIFRVGAIGQFDRRDDTYYPTSGVLASAELSYGMVTGGILRQHDRDYTKGVAKVARYSPVFREDVFAWQVVACAASDEAPFFDACSLGGADAFRGYSPTEFIDDALFSVQAEYRGRISRRLGYVVFAGAGSVGGDPGDALTSDYRLAGGVGARFRLSRKFPLDYAIDVSINQEGDNVLYVSVGQRF